MASYFLDSCAIAKRYTLERGTAYVQRLCAVAAAGNDDLFISQVALVEVVRVISAKARGPHRRRKQRLAARDRLITEFKTHCNPRGGDYDVITLTPMVVDRAGSLCKTSGIKSFDAAQLATALIVRDFAQMAGDPAPIFVSADDKLLGYATAQGFTVRDPEDFPDPSELALPSRAPLAVLPNTPQTWRDWFDILGRLLSRH